MNMKKTFTLIVLVMLSLTVFAQRGGGGGGFGGGGGRGGGGFSSGGRGGFGTYDSAYVNDSTTIMLNGGSLYFTSGRYSGSPIRDEELLDCMGEELFGKYEIAHKQFLRGDKQETIGILLYIPAVVVTIIAATKYDDEENLSPKLYTIGGSAAVAASTFFCLGTINKGIAKGRLRWIADTYNEQLEEKLRDKSTASRLEFAPSLIGYSVNDLAFGATVRLTF